MENLHIRIVSIVFIVISGAQTRAWADNDCLQIREVGAHLSLVRTNVGGRFIAESPASRTPIYGAALGGFAYFQLFQVNAGDAGVQLGLSYAPRGADTSLDGVPLSSFQSSYLEFPVLIRFNSHAFGATRVYALGGAVPGVLLAATQTNAEGDELDREEDTSRLDIGIAAGVGTQVSLSSRFAISLEFRYVHGLTNITDSNDSEILNRAMFFTFGAGASFGDRGSQ